MKQAFDATVTRNQLINRLHAAVSKDKKLYLCGVEPEDFLGVRRYIEPNQIVYEVKPEVILLEGDTPDACYQTGKADGSFCRQINDPRWESPSLRDVKQAADDLGCLVAGIDIDESKRKKLIKKYDIRPGRLTRTCERLREKSEDLHANSHDIPDKDYEALKSLSDALDDNYDLKTGGNPVIDSYRNLELMSQIIRPHTRTIIKYFSKKVLPEFNDFVEDFNACAKQMDLCLFQNIRNQYTGKQRVLCFLNYRHLAKDAYLPQHLRKKGIHFMAFVNYADFAKQPESASRLSLLPQAQKHA